MSVKFQMTAPTSPRTDPEEKYPLTKRSNKPKPWVALLCMCGCYGLVGWHCSAYGGVWSIGSWIGALGLTWGLLWGWQQISGVLKRGPKILVSIGVLSLVLTVAISFSRLFLLLIMVVASTIFARLELQISGLSRFWTLATLSIVSGTMIGLGWYLGKQFYPSSEYWLWSFII